MFKLIERTTFRLTLFAAALFVLVSNVSCTKKTESSSLNIQMPNWSAVTQRKVGTLSGTEVNAVTRVMINISGPGMATAVRIWDISDVRRVDGQLPVPPAEFSFEIPRGSDRLFQALVIVEAVDTSSSETGGGPITFLYGDVSKSLTQAIESVPIALVDQGTSSGSDGSLSGRFLTSSGSGPSGKVNMYYSPPNGRPEMIVQRTSIFSGFMHFFVPPSAQFSYRMADSNFPLFEKITLSSFDSLLSPKLLRLEVPAAFRSKDGSSAREATQARTKIVGFFGPGAVNEIVCYNTYAVSLNNLFTTSDLGNNGVVQWSAGSSLLTDARRIGGGQPYTGDMCPGGNGDFGVGHLFPRILSLQNGDSPLGIYGPFQELSPSSNNYLTASFDGTQLSLNWKYLKPTIGDSVDGVGVFTKTLIIGESSDLRWHDSAPCSNLTALGFTEVTRVGSGTQASPVESYTITSVNPLAYTSGRHVTALCPYSNTKGYYDFALTHSLNSGQQATATKIVVTRLGEPGVSTAGLRTKVSSGACTPFKIQTTDDFGNPARKMFGHAVIGVSQIGGGGATQFSDGPSCGSLVSTLNFNMFGSEAFFFMKTDSAATTFEVNVQDSGTAPLPQSTFYAVRASPTPASRAVAAAPPSIFRYECFPFFTTKASVDGLDRIPEGDSGAQSIDYTASLSQAGLSFYTDSSCDAPSGAISYPAVALSASVKFYARYTGAMSSISLAPFISPLTTESVSVNVIPPGPAVRTRLNISSAITVGDCVPVRLHSQDLQGRRSPVSVVSTTQFEYSSAPVGMSGMYSNASCSVPLAAATILQNDTSSGLFYFRWDTAETVLITSDGASTLPLSPVSIVVSP